MDNTQRPFTVSATTLALLNTHHGALIADVNRQMERRPDLDRLIGPGNRDRMRNNHKNHLEYVTSLCAQATLKGLDDTLRWVYRAYLRRGFTPAYFPVELDCWARAYSAHLPPEAADELQVLYRQMRALHDPLVASFKENPVPLADDPATWTDISQAFLERLLDGDYNGSLQLAGEQIHTREDLPDFYQHVITPCLYQIGTLWQDNMISVAHEHLATAIVSQLLAELFGRFAELSTSRGTVLATTVPGEEHDTGLRMIADLLELDGWTVVYGGPARTEEEITDLVLEHRPDLVMVSVTMVFSLHRLRDLTGALRRLPGRDRMGILGGGQATASLEDPKAWGLDERTQTAREAVQFARKWGTDHAQH